MWKLWVDDRRNAPDETWLVARNFQQAIDYLERGNVSVISLDHDLGDHDYRGNELTGYHIAMYIEERAFTHGSDSIPTTYYVHTDNPSGADRILQCLVAMCNRSAPGISIKRIDAKEAVDI